jgi:LmbE family N-acetylglucosaminyl deacetylase
LKGDIKVKTKNNIAIVVAHPDDEALGIAGTLIKHVQSQDNVFVIILSKGEDAKISNKSRNKDREANAKKWCQFIGANLYSFYDFPDQRFDQVPELDVVKCLEKDFKKIKPDIVYIHHLGDINKDHTVSAKSALVALRPMGKKTPEIRSFETPSSTDQAPYVNDFLFLPNLYISIDKYWHLKEESLNIYKKELNDAPHPRSIEAIKALAIKRGAESGFIMAEAFCIIRKLIE